MNQATKLKSVFVVLGAALILGSTGTFAWMSISQRALNEGTFVRAPGARVHDDYEGFDTIITQNGGVVNKDIYAENYSNKPIYARIKLTEYMETGTGAGEYTLSGAEHTMTPTAENQAQVLPNAGLDNATIADRSTWPAYLPNGVLSDGSISAIRQYVTWFLGDKNSERKIYMPTFNQNNANLESDTTGHAIEEATWTTNTNYNTTQKTLLGKQDDWVLGEEHTSTLRTYDEKKQQEVTTAGTKHIAVPTVMPDHEGYLTMSEWIALDQPTGNFWVHDTDGWIYWANPIAAHSATSLLLDKLDVSFTPDDMYYTINVISEFATLEDLPQWTGVSSMAEQLLTKLNEP